MWIALRLLLAFCGFLIRRYAHLIKRRYESRDAHEFYEQVNRGKHGRVTSHVIGLPLHDSLDGVVFKLTQEGYADSFFKFFGFNSEFQTGDAEFDRAVYIASDHPFFCRVLQQQAELRLEIGSLFSQCGVESIGSDGRHIYFRATGKKIDMESAARTLMFTVADRIQSGLKTLPSRYADTFAWKALLTEGITWSLFLYSLGAALEFFFRDEDIYIEPYRLLKASGLWSVLIFAAVFFLIRLMFRQSSRAHRILVESGLLLLFSIPVTTAQMISDLNTELDNTSHIYQTQLTEKYQVRHRRKRGYYYTYHIQTAGIPAVLPSAHSLRVTADKYNALSEGEQIDISTGDGRLGFTWIREIRNHVADY